jgi:hypothetical protein
VSLAVKLGRFCVWADCGMGKTAMQLEWARQVCEHTGGRVLVLAPLAVSHQTVREAEKFGIEGVAFAARPGDTDARIVVTNYQKLDHFDPKAFVGVVLDETNTLKPLVGAGDLSSQLALAVPMCILYEIGILAAGLFIKHTKAPDAETDAKPSA